MKNIYRQEILDKFKVENVLDPDSESRQAITLFLVESDNLMGEIHEILLQEAQKTWTTKNL